MIYISKLLKRHYVIHPNCKRLGLPQIVPEAARKLVSPEVRQSVFITASIILMTVNSQVLTTALKVSDQGLQIFKVGVWTCQMRYDNTPRMTDRLGVIYARWQKATEVNKILSSKFCCRKNHSTITVHPRMPLSYLPVSIVESVELAQIQPIWQLVTSISMDIHGFTTRDLQNRLFAFKLNLESKWYIS